ncbi:hypothetical protein [Methanocalculus sp.]|uniref:hypothetical protein n=1 Tax=Methanocalculus sp. TaxID=2004547 RepID=UPI002615F762|nr:hypothetical protein [Methanocalculus sp.]
MRQTYNYSFPPQRPRRISIEGIIFTEGVITGLFSVIKLKIGVSIDPVDMMILILKTTQTVMNKINPTVNSGISIDVICTILPIIALICSIATILLIKERIFGAIIYFLGFLLSFIALMILL